MRPSTHIMGKTSPTHNYLMYMYGISWCNLHAREAADPVSGAVVLLMPSWNLSTNPVEPSIRQSHSNHFLSVWSNLNATEGSGWEGDLWMADSQKMSGDAGKCWPLLICVDIRAKKKGGKENHYYSNHPRLLLNSNFHEVRGHEHCKISSAFKKKAHHRCCDIDS